ncbi:hypothetical protein EJ06DRAFT_528123 [Trichodelitschia bisporula]|uniref:Uncharacterized protein n=1 Tax=Trichodelitschia bisporula TaxID=703511 RepID=A0A6G1I4R3_9PEZI|nr:hypothetical protein EJ06DRAFT_528123 [Trichodelitschia bisporula]
MKNLCIAKQMAVGDENICDIAQTQLSTSLKTQLSISLKTQLTISLKTKLNTISKDSSVSSAFQRVTGRFFSDASYRS